MTIVEYQAQVKAYLITSPIVTSFEVVREREAEVDGHLRIRLTLADDTLLEFSEYLRRLPDGTVEVIVYSYHWADEERNMIRRWDNAAHYPDLSGTPHHIHDGRTNQVIPGQPVDIYKILETMSQEID